MNQNLMGKLVTMMTEEQLLLQQLFDVGKLPSESRKKKRECFKPAHASRA